MPLFSGGLNASDFVTGSVTVQGKGRDAASENMF